MQQFQSDLAGFLPERGILARSTAIPMRMACDGIALFGALPPADAVTERSIMRLLSPAALIEGVDHRLARLAAQAGSGAGFAMTLPPLANLSNGYFRVHPRRNDRLVSISPALRALFPGVDFMRFDFTGHLMSTLAQTDAQAFARLEGHLSTLWAERLHRCLGMLPPFGVLIDPAGASGARALQLGRVGTPLLALDPRDPVAINAHRLMQALQKAPPRRG
jgi:hypothetical protein